MFQRFNSGDTSSKSFDFILQSVYIFICLVYFFEAISPTKLQRELQDSQLEVNIIALYRIPTARYINYIIYLLIQSCTTALAKHIVALHYTKV